MSQFYPIKKTSKISVRVRSLPDTRNEYVKRNLNET